MAQAIQPLPSQALDLDEITTVDRRQLLQSEAGD
jgi:hypothetical protein